MVKISYKRIVPTNDFLDFLYSKSFHHRSQTFAKVVFYEDRLCKMSFFVGSVVPLSGVRGASVFSVVSFSTVAPFLNASPITKGSNSMERVLMGDKCMYGKDTTS